MESDKELAGGKKEYPPGFVGPLMVRHEVEEDHMTVRQEVEWCWEVLHVYIYGYCWKLKGVMQLNNGG